MDATATLAERSLLTYTAGDLMSREVVQLSENMPLREAAQLLSTHHISGAPVVNCEGRCIGVLSASDFLRLEIRREEVPRSETQSQAVSCPFVERQNNGKGADVYRCNLPPGDCPVQVKERGPDGLMTVLCSEPHSVFAEWQVVESTNLPGDQVRHFMTHDPVMIPINTRLGDIARLMIDAHIHRIIVVNEQQMPVGVVSSTDVLAAVARADQN